MANTSTKAGSTTATMTTSSSSSKYTAASRLTMYKNRSEQAKKAEREYARLIIPALTARSYHIPGNSWCQDWLQHFTNNHPVFGMCCHHKLHPVTLGQRLVVLVGSLAFGLMLANCIYMYFLFYTNEGVEGEFVSVAVAANVTVGAENRSVNTVSLTNYEAFLWTAGSALHTMFDLSTWYITACACCQRGGCLECLHRCRFIGSYLVLFAVVIIGAAASFVVVLRASLASNEITDVSNVTSGGLFDDEVQLQVDDTRSFRFLIGWSVQVTLSLFVYYPILGTILFTGILGCFRLPLLGGRPREIWLEEEEGRKLREARTEEEEPWERL